MDFERSEDQVALAEGVARLCAGRFPLESVRVAEGRPTVADGKGWAELGEAGVFALRVSDADGGLGLGLAEAAVVFEELGRALVPGPLVASSLAAGLVPGAADGSVMVGAVRRPAGPGPILIEDLGAVDVLIVVDDGAGELRLVERGAVTGAPLQRSLDPLTPMWRVEALPEGDLVGGEEDQTRWGRDGNVLTGALGVGLALATMEMTVAYARTREQFGRAIGSFQAVKHLCADMLVRAESARAAVEAAAVTVDQPGVGDPVRAAAGAALLGCEAAQANARSCIQVHGGMGFTWEVPAHLYLMRAQVLAGSLPSPADLAAVVADRY